MAKGKVNNPLERRLITKPTKRPKLDFKEKKITAIATTAKARELLKQHPDLITEFKMFIKAKLPIIIFEKKYKFEKTDNKNLFLIATKDKTQKTHHFFVERIIKEPGISKDKWASHAYNKTVILNELRKVGINTVPVHFAFVNTKRESFIAYEYTGLTTVREARQKELITTQEYKKFQDNINTVYQKYRDKIKSRNGNIGLGNEKLSFGFFNDYEILIDPVTKKLYVFNPHVESINNTKEEFSNIRSRDLREKFRR